MLKPFDLTGLPLVDATGFLKLGPATDDRFRQLLKMFEERATTLTSPATALARIGAASVGASAEDAKKAAGDGEGWSIENIWKMFALRTS